MKAGFFEKDVTPPIGAYLAGYPSRSKGSEGIDDPLFLRIAALEDDEGERLVIVTADLLKFPKLMAWRTKAWCEATLGLKSPSLIINLSHTHSAPTLFYQECYPHWPLDMDYINGLEQSIREGIAAALADLSPARVTFGIHQAHFGVSRRLPDPERGGKVKMAPNPDGYYDPDLPVLAFYWDGDVQPAAVLYSYACHPTSKNTLNISADYPCELSRGLKRNLGEEVMTLFVQGAGGSIMPRPEARTPEAWARASESIAHFVRSDSMQELNLKLSAAETEFGIPYDMDRAFSAEELLEMADPATEDLPEGARPANRSIVRLWAQHLYEMVRTDCLPTEFRMHLQRIELSEEVQLFAMSGEVTAEVGRMIKDLFPQRETLFFGYCSYTDTYIPIAAMLEEEGHEAYASMFFHVRPAPFVHGIDEIIREQVLALAASG